MNMSYCRFENTSHDLHDCVYAMEEAQTLKDLDLSETEMRDLKFMRALCLRYLKEIDRLFEGQVVDFQDY